MNPSKKKRRLVRNDSPGIDLHERRARNDLRLKSAFESIFEKYGKDFSGIGDQVDLETGKIIVDHGHLLGMKHEVDPGREEDLYDELNPDWESEIKDPTKILPHGSADHQSVSSESYFIDSSKSQLRSHPSSKPTPDLYRLNPSYDRPAVEPTWRAPPLPTQFSSLLQAPLPLTSNTHRPEQERSISPLGPSIWAPGPFKESKKPVRRRKKALLPSHLKALSTPPPSTTEKDQLEPKLSSFTDERSKVSFRLRPEVTPLKSPLLITKASFPLSKSTGIPEWTLREDRLLRHLKVADRLTYSQIIAYYPGKSEKDLEDRWFQLQGLNVNAQSDETLHLNERSAAVQHNKHLQETLKSLSHVYQSQAAKEGQDEVNSCRAQEPLPSRIVNDKIWKPGNLPAEHEFMKEHEASRKSSNDQTKFMAAKRRASTSSIDELGDDFESYQGDIKKPSLIINERSEHDDGAERFVSDIDHPLDQLSPIMLTKIFQKSISIHRAVPTPPTSPSNPPYYESSVSPSHRRRLRGTGEAKTLLVPLISAVRSACPPVDVRPNNIIERRKEPNPRVNPATQKKKDASGLLKRTKISVKKLSRITSLGNGIAPDQRLSELPKNSIDANEKFMEDIWELPAERTLTQDQKAPPRKVCSHCFNQTSYRLHGKIAGYQVCSACYQHRLKNNADRPMALINSLRKKASRHTNSRSLHQRHTTSDNDVRGSESPLGVFPKSPVHTDMTLTSLSQESEVTQTEKPSHKHKAIRRISSIKFPQEKTSRHSGSLLLDHVEISSDTYASASGSPSAMVAQSPRLIEMNLASFTEEQDLLQIGEIPPKHKADRSTSLLRSLQGNSSRSGDNRIPREAQIKSQKSALAFDSSFGIAVKPCAPTESAMDYKAQKKGNPRTSKAIVGPERTLASNDLSDDELSIPMKTVSTPMSTSTAKKSTSSSLCASRRRTSHL